MLRAMQCKQFFTLYKKELRSLLTSPVTYVCHVLLHLGLTIPFIGVNFWLNAGISELQSFFLNAPLLFCIIIPLLTMHVLSHERKSGTDTLLFSFPIAERTIVLTKYLSLLSVYGGMIVVSTAIPLSIFSLGYFDYAPCALAYVTLVLFGAALLSLSCAVASYVSYAAVGFVLNFTLAVMALLVHIPARVFISHRYIRACVSWVSFVYHFESAARGIFDLSDFAFYIFVAIAGIELQCLIVRVRFR